MHFISAMAGLREAWNGITVRTNIRKRIALWNGATLLSARRCTTWGMIRNIKSSSMFISASAFETVHVEF